MSAGEDLKSIVEQVLQELPADPVEAIEQKARRLVIGELFIVFEATSQEDRARLEAYLRHTAQIPFDKLSIGLTAIIRSHQWKSLPQIAESWCAARCAAGMDRAQYIAGYYLPPKTNWPPSGKRYAIHQGELEDIALGAENQLAAGLTPELLTTTTREGESDGNSDTD
jgi:hypothetical protein